MDYFSKTPSFNKPESSIKYERESIDKKLLYRDLETSKKISSNIQTMSEEIRVHVLTSLSTEPPRWDTLPYTLFTRRQNDPPENVDDENLVLHLVLDLSGGDKDAKDNSDGEDKLS